MNFKQYINESDKLKGFKKFAEHANTDFKIWDYLETEHSDLAKAKTLIHGSLPWTETFNFIHKMINDKDNEEYGVHWYGERERAKQILQNFLERNKFFTGI